MTYVKTGKPSGTQRKPAQWFIDKLNLLHSNKYEYFEEDFDPSLKDKVNLRRIRIKCNHGIKEMAYATHSAGGGCNYCSGVHKVPVPLVGKENILEENSSNFIKQSKALYGDTFDYTNLGYTSMVDKVNIKCNTHNTIISINPKSHLKSHGCQQCTAEEKGRLNFKEFLVLAKEKYGTLYTYTEDQSFMSNGKAEIVCKEHGKFHKTRAEFVSKGKGCPSCVVRKPSSAVKRTLENFIQDSNIKHGNTYNYSKSIYIKSSIKVYITCKEHGDFEQTPAQHLRGRGCPTCAIKNRWDKRGRLDYSKFTEKAVKVHGNKYTYPIQEVTANRATVKIICRNHGEFEQLVGVHINMKAGCPRCSKNFTDTKETFIEKANLVHEGRYTYDNFVYTNCKTKSLITCSIHGDFEQTADSHINTRAGCLKCLPKGFYNSKYFEENKEDSLKPATLYLIEFKSDAENFIKIGLTTKSIDRRFKDVKVSTGYTITKIIEVRDNLFNVWNKEQEVIRTFYNNKYQPLIPFKGDTECFAIKCKEDIIKFIE